MKTIAHVVEATATGTLSMVCMAANGSARHGHAVHVVYSRRPETPADLSQMFDPAITLHEVPMGGKAGIRSIPALRRQLLRISPDVIHLHSSFAGFLGRLATVGILPHARLFYSPHCISMMRQDISWQKYVFAALERVASLRSCTYLACSESERKAIRHWVGVNALVLENAVNFGQEESPSRVRRTETSPFTVITVGGVRLQKNPELFGLIHRKCVQAGIDARFVWIGDGDGHLVAALRKAGVEVTGWKSRPEIAAALASSQVYLSTSRWEGMPVSLIEAMASRTFILATSCAGNVDVIDHGRTGLLFHDPEEACSVIRKVAAGEILTDDILADAFAESGTRFGLDRFTEDLSAVYFRSIDGNMAVDR